MCLMYVQERVKKMEGVCCRDSVYVSERERVGESKRDGRVCDSEDVCVRVCNHLHACKLLKQKGGGLHACVCRLECVCVCDFVCLGNWKKRAWY